MRLKNKAFYIRQGMERRKTVFDMQKIGATIAGLRRAGDMTQMELADRLGISYQAVSSWERGGTMPDISKLPELAEIFDVTIDQLLGHWNPLVESAACGALEGEHFGLALTDAAQLAEAAPLLRPKQVEAAAGTLTGSISLEELTGLAPFLSRGMVNQLIGRLSGRPAFSELISVAPFVDRNVLERLVGEAVEQGEPAGYEQLIGIAPFLSRRTVGQLSELLDSRPGLSELTALAPFVERHILETLITEALRRGEEIGWSVLAGLAPFISRKLADQLTAQALKAE